MTRFGAAGLMMSPAPMITANPAGPGTLPPGADAIAHAHAAGAAGPARSPTYRPDDRVDGAAEKGLRYKQDVEQRPRADKDIVEISLHHHQQCRHSAGQGSGAAAPSGSIRVVMKNRPTIPEGRQTPSKRRMRGVVFSAITASLQAERGATGLRQASHASGGNQPRIFEQVSHRVFSTSAKEAGGNLMGSIIKAQASDLRASSMRPMRISQRSDSAPVADQETSTSGDSPTRADNASRSAAAATRTPTRPTCRRRVAVL